MQIIFLFVFPSLALSSGLKRSEVPNVSLLCKLTFIYTYIMHIIKSFANSVTGCAAASLRVLVVSERVSDQTYILCAPLLAHNKVEIGCGSGMGRY